MTEEYKTIKHKQPFVQNKKEFIKLMNDNSTEEIQVNPEYYGIQYNSETMLCYLYTKEKKIVTYIS